MSVERLTDQHDRHAAANDLGRCLVAEASAGTGKTSLIVERVANLIGAGRAGIHEMAVITFTEMAAAELEERIRSEIEARIEALKKREGKPLRGPSAAAAPEDINAGSEIGAGPEIGVGAEIGAGPQIGVGSEIGMDPEIGGGPEIGAGPEIGVGPEIGPEIGVGLVIGAGPEIGAGRRIGVVSEVGAGSVLARFLGARRDLDRASIQTIHAFAATLLRRRPVEARVDPRFAVSDPQRQEALFDEEWTRYVAEQAAAQSPPLRTLLVAGAKLGTLRGLAERFVENRDVALGGAPARSPAPDAAAHARELRDWIVAELARAREQVVQPTDRLFRRLEEVAERAARIAELPAEMAHRELLRMAVERIPKRMGAVSKWRAGTLDLARSVAAEWNERIVRYPGEHAVHLAGEAAVWLLGFVDAYERRKSREGVLDFQDLLLRARDLLALPKVADDLRRRYRFVLVDEFQDTDPLQVEIVALLTGQGDSASWESRRPGPGSLFIVGDPKQSIYRFRRADADLYQKAVRWLQRASESGEDLRITNNFRCRPEIAAWVNAVFEPLFGDQEDEPQGSPGSASTERCSRMHYAPIVARRPASQGPAVVYLIPEEIPVEGRAAGGKRRVADARVLEAATIARWIRTSILESRWCVGTGVRMGKRGEERTEKEEDERPARFGDVALLLRGFGDVGVYEDALRDAGIECSTSGGRRYFRRPEVAWFGALLRAVESPHDEVAVVAALRSPFFGLSDEAILEGRLARRRLDPLRPGEIPDDAGRALRRLGEWHAIRNDAPVGSTVRRILDESGALVLAALREGGEQGALNLLKIAHLARRHEASGGGFRGFVRWLGRASREELEEGDSPVLETGERAVRVMTIHAAKGLEFPIVIVADLARRVPRSESFLVDRDGLRIEFEIEKLGCRSAGYEALCKREAIMLGQERRRLLYVAATRARDLLVLPVPMDRAEDTFAQDLWEAGALPESLLWGRGTAEMEREGPEPLEANGLEEGAERDRDPRRDSMVVERRGREGEQGITLARLGEVLSPASDPALDSEETTRREPLLLPNGIEVRVERVRIPPESVRYWGEPGRQQGKTKAAGPVAERAGAPGTLDQWEAERSALLAKASAGPAFLVASRASGEDAEDGRSADPSSRAALLSDLPEVASTPARALENRAQAAKRARAFGLAVHGVLEAADLADPSSLAPLAAAQAAVQGCPDREEEVAAAARRALGLEAIREASRRRVLRETPVLLVEEGTLVEGQIDLVYEQEDGSLVVVDFKTDDVKNMSECWERAAHYLAQVALYAAALERATGRTVRESALLFLAPGIEVRLPYDAQARAAASAAIERASLRGS